MTTIEETKTELPKNKEQNKKRLLKGLFQKLKKQSQEIERQKKINVLINQKLRNLINEKKNNKNSVHDNDQTIESLKKKNHKYQNHCVKLVNKLETLNCQYKDCQNQLVRLVDENHSLQEQSLFYENKSKDLEEEIENLKNMISMLVEDIKEEKTKVENLQKLSQEQEKKPNVSENEQEQEQKEEKENEPEPEQEQENEDDKFELVSNLHEIINQLQQERDLLAQRCNQLSQDNKYLEEREKEKRRNKFKAFTELQKKQNHSKHNKSSTLQNGTSQNTTTNSENSTCFSSSSGNSTSSSSFATSSSSSQEYTNSLIGSLLNSTQDQTTFSSRSNGNKNSNQLSNGLGESIGNSKEEEGADKIFLQMDNMEDFFSHSGIPSVVHSSPVRSVFDSDLLAIEQMERDKSPISENTKSTNSGQLSVTHSSGESLFGIDLAKNPISTKIEKEPNDSKTDNNNNKNRDEEISTDDLIEDLLNDLQNSNNGNFDSFENDLQKEDTTPQKATPFNKIPKLNHISPNPKMIEFAKFVKSIRPDQDFFTDLNNLEKELNLFKEEVGQLKNSQRNQPEPRKRKHENNKGNLLKERNSLKKKIKKQNSTDITLSASFLGYCNDKKKLLQRKKAKPLKKNRIFKIINKIIYEYYTSDNRLIRKILPKNISISLVKRKGSKNQFPFNFMINGGNLRKIYSCNDRRLLARFMKNVRDLGAKTPNFNN
ncbi:a-type inclusion protein [Anaeramoeba flamelloides]|uniref:A-type inclusion protein n=1 Tax=Anaeramoeba flamelloides TaxID=1746091 RepID=A0ABQ8XPU8_9EUKA|nr:a-type inclusion protein [Anaeramoeba flamelloides]